MGMVFNMAGGLPLPLLTSPGAAGDLRAGKQLIDNNGDVLNGTLLEVEQATPTISVSSGGLITASATQSGGIVEGGTKSSTKQLTTQGAKTVTPGTTNQTAVASGRYTTGAVTVKGDANLKAENIAEGVSIFGVTGTHSGGTQLESVSLSVNIISGLYSNLYYYSIVDGYTTVSYRASYDVTDCLKDSIVVFTTSADTDIKISGDYAIIPIDSPGQRGFVCRGNVEMDVTTTGPV